MTKAVVSLSGGMDSTTLLGVAIEKHGKQNVDAVGFTYGSKHNQYENQAAWDVAEHYGIDFELIDLSHISEYLKSDLLKTGGDIPEGHYEAESMGRTVVPGRNMIFASILTGIAWTRKADEVWLGVHAGDHAIYPDCRENFCQAMNQSMWLGSGERVCLRVPFINDDKTSILRKGYEIDVPYYLTRTCYKDQPVACGKCGSCQERLEAFRNIGIVDPIRYETREALPKS